MGRRNEPSTNGVGDYDSHRESFRNPIWQSDEDDDDDDIDNFRHSESGLHFNIFSNPLEMSLYFESQIDDILKNFFRFNNTPFDGEGIAALPFATPDEDDSLRDKVLKSKPDTFAITDVPIENKVDTDLDGRVSTEEFLKMWNKGNVERKFSVPNNFSIGRCVRKEIVRRPDGTIEKKQVIRDNEGNEETITSKEMGDKTYVVTIRKDKNGVETRSENLINMDDSELKDFIKKWKPVKDNIDGHDTTFNRFPWEKFFGPNPKL